MARRKQKTEEPITVAELTTVLPAAVWLIDQRDRNTIATGYRAALTTSVDIAYAATQIVRALRAASKATKL